MVKLFDRIKYLLELSPLFRNSDEELQWKIWVDTGSVVNGVMTKSGFLKAINPESIRRTRQKVQESHPELKADPSVLALREEKEKTGGNFAYQETLEIPLEELERQLDVLVMRWKGKVPPEGSREYYQFRADKTKAIKLRIDIEAKQAEKVFAS